VVQPQAEPVAWLSVHGDIYRHRSWPDDVPLYTGPPRAAAPQPQAEPVDLTRPPMDWGRSRWFDTCKFLVTFDGEAMHPLQLGSVMGGKDAIERMVFECAAPQPQASAEDVDAVERGLTLGATDESWAAWQRIRADYERMGVVK
jgi:hypothetical protein